MSNEHGGLEEVLSVLGMRLLCMLISGFAIMIFLWKLLLFQVLAEHTRPEVRAVAAKLEATKP